MDPRISYQICIYANGDRYGILLRKPVGHTSADGRGFRGLTRIVEEIASELPEKEPVLLQNGVPSSGCMPHSSPWLRPSTGDRIPSEKFCELTHLLSKVRPDLQYHTLQ